MWTKAKPCGLEAIASDETGLHHDRITIEISTQIKMSLANQARRAAQRDAILLQAHSLRPTRRVHPHRRFCPAGCHRSYRRSARAGSRRARLAYSTLEKACGHVMLAFNYYQLNVHAIFEF